MKISSTHWKAALAALAFSMTAPAAAQESTGDAFLDAMLTEEQTSPKPAPAPAPEKLPSTDTQRRGTTAPARAASPAPASSKGSSTVMTDELRQAERELGPATGLFANDIAFEGKTVTSVQVRYIGGTASIPDSRVYDLLQTVKGGKYSGLRVNADLERLVTEGVASQDARVMVQPQGDGVGVIYELRPSKVLGGVGFTGNKRFDENELRTEAIKLPPGRAINDRALAAARAALIKYYFEAGYPDTKVTWRMVPTSRPEFRDVIFDIQEGREVSMNEIEFKGNREFDSEQLRQVMQTKERSFFTWITKSGRVDREQVQSDLEAVENLYRNHGYLHARVTDVKYFDNGDPEGRQKLRMVVTIQEGPRYRVRNVSFGKLSVYTPKQLEPGLSMLNGDIYSLQKVVDDSNMIRKYYGVKGYADANVRPEINEVGVDKNGMRLIDIRYDVDEGNRYRVGRILVRGNTKTKTKVILRELPLKPGDNLNSVDLDVAAKRLENLGYFVPQSLSVTQESSRYAGYRDINIDVEEQMTGQLTFGVAFSTVENVYLYATATQKNFDIGGFTNGVFVGGGQRLTVSGRLGTEYQSASVFLLEPWFLDRKLAFGNEVYYSDSTYLSDYYRQQNFGYAVSLRRALDDFQSVKLEYRIEQYMLDEEYDAPPFFRENSGDYTRSHLRLSYEFDSRDAVITPRKGGNFLAYVGYSGPGSTVQTYTVGMSGSVYYNSFWDSIFSINFGAEAIDTVDNDKQVPLFERCYLGGPNNMRGYRFRDLGMVDKELAGDETMGGRSCAYAQFEVSLPIIEAFRFAMFMDVGYISDKLKSFDSDGISVDCGIGLRLNLPMGPIAVDYAIPLKTGNGIDDGGQFQFYADYKY